MTADENMLDMRTPVDNEVMEEGGNNGTNHNMGDGDSGVGTVAGDNILDELDSMMIEVGDIESLRTPNAEEDDTVELHNDIDFEE